MPEGNKKTLKGQLQDEIAMILNQCSELNIVKLADGAKDNRRFLSHVLLPGQGIETLDFFHASDHLSDAIDAVYGKNTPKAKAQYAKYRSLLKNDFDGAEKIINALRYLSNKHPTNEKVETELNYFRNNRHRMNYAKEQE